MWEEEEVEEHLNIIIIANNNTMASIQIFPRAFLVIAIIMTMTD